jgi:hypothetical protein
MRYVRYHQPKVVPKPPAECSIDGCHDEAHARGWCPAHYALWWRMGHPRPASPTRPKVPRIAGPTRPELALRTLLDGFGVEFYEQYRIGVYTVDFYVPKTKLVLEADGLYWHQDEAKERARDEYLLRNPLVASIVHLTDKQLKPWLPRERWSKEYRKAPLAA